MSKQQQLLSMAVCLVAFLPLVSGFSLYDFFWGKSERMETPKTVEDMTCLPPDGDTSAAAWNSYQICWFFKTYAPELKAQLNYIHDVAQEVKVFLNYDRWLTVGAWAVCYAFADTNMIRRFSCGITCGLFTFLSMRFELSRTAHCVWMGIITACVMVVYWYTQTSKGAVRSTPKRALASIIEAAVRCAMTPEVAPPVAATAAAPNVPSVLTGVNPAVTQPQADLATAAAPTVAQPPGGLKVSPYSVTPQMRRKALEELLREQELSEYELSTEDD